MQPEAPRRAPALSQVDGPLVGALASRQPETEELRGAEVQVAGEASAGEGRRFERVGGGGDGGASIVERDVAAVDGLVHPVDAEEREDTVGEGGGEVVTLLEGGEEAIVGADLFAFDGVLVPWEDGVE